MGCWRRSNCWQHRGWFAINRSNAADLAARPCLFDDAFVLVPMAHLPTKWVMPLGLKLGRVLHADGLCYSCCAA